MFSLAKVGAIMPATMTCNSDALVFALDKNRNNPICVASPEVAKASTVVTVACCCRQWFHLGNGGIHRVQH